MKVPLIIGAVFAAPVVAGGLFAGDPSQAVLGGMLIFLIVSATAMGFAKDWRR